MPRGGPRPNSGPKKGTKYKPRKNQSKKSVSKSKRVIDDPELMPIEYMLKVMRDPLEAPDRRDKMAFWLAPYLYPKAGATGKKEDIAEQAKKVGEGIFSANRPPLKAIK